MARKMPKPLQVEMISKYIGEHTDIDLAAVDVSALVDPTLHYYENWQQIKEKFGIKTREEIEKEMEEEAEKNRDPDRMRISIREDLEETFPGTAPEVEITANGVVITLTPFDVTLAPGRGMPVVSGRIEQYPSPLKEEVADKYFKSFTEESIEKSAREEEKDLEEARKLAEQVEEAEALEEVEAARAEAEEAAEEAESLQESVQEREEQIEELQEKIDWLNKQRLAPDRVEELEEEMSNLRETVSTLKKKTNEIMLESKGFGYGKAPETPEIEGIGEEMEEVRGEIDRIHNRLENFQNQIVKVIKEMMQRITKGMEQEREREPIPPPPPWFENVVNRYPDILETPKKILTQKGETVELSWEDFAEYLDRVAGMDMPEIEELNKKAAPVPEDLPQEKKEAKEEAKALAGFWNGYVNYRKSGQPLPRPEERVSPKMLEVRRQVMEWVEEKKPELDPKSVWRSVSSVYKTRRLTDISGVGGGLARDLETLGYDNIKKMEQAEPEEIARETRDSTLITISKERAEKIIQQAKQLSPLTKKEQLRRVKEELASKYDISFPEIEVGKPGRKKISKETIKEQVEKFVKQKIGKQTQDDPDTVWNGVKVFFNSAKSIEENKKKIMEVLEDQYPQLKE